MAPEDSGESESQTERYRRLGRLGTGGMASVFLAEDQVLCRQVAIKRVHTASPDDMLKRFRREARIGASLSHPNIVGVFDSISEDDGLLIVMEYVEGESLSERLRRTEMEPAEAIAILEQIASALDHIHSRGVIHRDVKPSNVLVRSDGVAKLADLGIATATDMTSITASGSVLGSLSYIAPERLRGGRVESSCDVFSLGAVAFEMLAGRRLHDASTPEEQVRLASSESTPDLIEAWPDAPPGAARVLASAMDPDPRARPASAEGFVASLREELIEGEHLGEDTQPLTRETVTAPLPLAFGSEHSKEPAPPRAPPPPPPRTFAPPPLKRSGRTGALAGLALAIVAIAGVAFATSSGGGDSGSGSGGAGKTADKGSPSTTKSQNAGGAGGSTSATPADTTSTTTTPADTTPTTTTATTPVKPAPVPTGDAAALNDQGFGLLAAGDPEGAIAPLQAAVDSYPPGAEKDQTYYYALFNLGNALRLAGRPDEAIPLLKERLQYPDQTDTVQAELDLAIAEAGGKEKTPKAK